MPPCGRPFNGKQGGRCRRWYVLESIPGITVLRAYLVASTLLPRAFCPVVRDDTGWWMALPAKRWVADVRRSFSHHLGSSCLSPLHMSAKRTSSVCRWRCMAFGINTGLLCRDDTDEPRGLVCAMVKAEFGLEELVGASLQRRSCLFSAAAA